MKINKFNILIILLILFLSLGSLSAHEDGAADSSLGAHENPLNEDINRDIKENTDFGDKVSEYIENGLFDENINHNRELIDSASSEGLNSNGLDDSNPEFGDIQSLIDSAEIGDTILLNGTYTGSGKALTVNRSLTIDGQGLTTLNANKLSSILKVNADNVFLINIVFSNSKGSSVSVVNGNFSLIENCSFYNNSAENGGAVYLKSTDFLINNCIFDSNEAGNIGGAIYSFSEKGLIRNCRFCANHALYEGGSVFTNSPIMDSRFINNSVVYYGGAVCCDSILINCSFINNTAIEGGAVFSWYDSSVMDCSFLNNSASDGGAIYGSCNVTNCNFTSNVADDGYGGAIYGNSISINSNFLNNKANIGGAICEGSAINSSFINNSAGDGGAMFSWDADTASDCIFINNSVKGSGGATYNINVIKSNFTNNSAGDNGGAMSFGLASNCIFSENHALNFGGALYDVAVADSIFEYNSAKSGGAMVKARVENSSFRNNNASYYGGAIFDSNVSTDCKFSLNVASNGSDIYKVEWFNPVTVKSFCDLNELINNNSASEIYLDGNYTCCLPRDIGFMGGIPINRPLTIYGNGFTIDAIHSSGIFTVNSSDVVFKDIIFVNASSKEKGSAIRGLSTAINCTFLKNYNFAVYNTFAVNCSFINNSFEGDGGGAVYADSIDSYSILNCIFLNNGGNAVYLHHVEYSFILNSTFNNNYATDGAAVYLNSVNSSIIMNSTFTNNFAYELCGGAIYDNSFNSTILNCYFKNNSAYTIYDYEWEDGEGGAIFSDCENALIENCTFISNDSIYGGAVYSTNSPLLIKNSSFLKNKANYGAAVYGACSIINSSFSNNKAELDGGAIYIKSNISRIDGCLFLSNNADCGGAVYNEKNCLITKSNFTQNQAVSKGGAVSFAKNCGGRIDNCIFTKNTAKEDGGAIDWNIKSKNVSGSKFINNSSPRENNICGLYTIKVTKSGVYAGNILLTINLYNAFFSNGAKNGKVILTFTNSKGKRTTVSLNTNAKGIVKYYLAMAAGKYTVSFKSNQDLNKTLSLTVKACKAKLSASKMTTTYKSGRTFNVKVVNTMNKKKPTNVKIALKIYTGKKAKTYYAFTKNGLACFDISSVSSGTHKVIVSSALGSVKASRITTKLVIKKANFKVTALKVKNGYNKNQYFKVKVITKNTKKPAKALNIKVRVYTGKKYKVYSIRTNTNGIALLNTKSIKRGTHGVIVTSGDRNAVINVKSSIAIV